MAIHATDQQQIEMFKQWWKNNGTSTVLIFVFALIISFGWRYWLQYREHVLEQASENYEQLLNSVVNNKADEAVAEADNLMTNYSHTPYAPLAALMLARQSVYQNNFSDAENRLMWVIKHGHNKSISEMARIRAARVLIAENKPQQALDLLNIVDDAAYTPEIDEIKGDAYLTLGQKDNARMAYQQSMNSLPGYAVAQPLLRMKYDDLAVPTQNNSPMTTSTALAAGANS